jgi:large subunit ribosomal protein L24
MNRIKVNDHVVITAGKDKGKQGKVLKIIDGERCVVEGINLMKKHVKPNPNKGEKGGIISKEASLHISNVMPFNSASGKGGRVGYKVVNEQKVRYFKSDDQVIDN